MAETRTLLTAEEFAELSANQEAARYELVKGELVEMPPVGEMGSGTATELALRLGPHVRQHTLGRVFVELGFCLECRPDTVRAPDVSFVKAERLPDRLRPGFFPGAPDLAIEVVSPNDKVTDLDSKIKGYLEHGTLRVWVVSPGTQTVVVYRADGTAHRYTSNDVLVDEEILPGFSLPLAELFS